MEPDDQIAEWLVKWEEARAASQPPPALDQLPAELRPRAREGLRLLRGFARMSHGLTTTAPSRRADPPQVPPDTPRYRFEVFLACGGMGEVWRGRDTVLAREVALKVLREQVFAAAPHLGHAASGQELLEAIAWRVRRRLRRAFRCGGDGRAQGVRHPREAVQQPQALAGARAQLGR